jgi:hypothetical protein
MSDDEYDGWDRVLKAVTPIYFPRDGAMPTAKHSKRKAASKETWRDYKKSKAIGRAKYGIRNRRTKRAT